MHFYFFHLLLPIKSLSSVLRALILQAVMGAKGIITWISTNFGIPTRDLCMRSSYCNFNEVRERRGEERRGVSNLSVSLNLTD